MIAVVRNFIVKRATERELEIQHKKRTKTVKRILRGGWRCRPVKRCVF